MKAENEIREISAQSTAEIKWYREKIVEMVEEIDNPLILKLVYGFTKSGYEEEKAGRK